MTEEQSPEGDIRRDSELNKFFRVAIKTNANDLHLKVGSPPKLRIKGQLKNTTGEVLSKERLEELVYDILTPNQKEAYLSEGTLDFVHKFDDGDRFRVNIFSQRGLMSLVARRVNTIIPSLESLNLPAILKNICDRSQGLILVAGPSGCGKTTTIVTMLDHINSTRSSHIMTIEDPIEYLFTDKKSIVSQREIGIDVKGFNESMKYLVRQDPDVVFIGEMRDADTVKAAMRAAETGHLVFGTMHAANCAQSVQRLLDLFPQNERGLVRQTLSLTLTAIISQILLPSIKENVDRVPALEILIANSTVRKLISESREAD
ncbi:MAG: PilT/PilU family type 4a pilus ATPase, partial [Candidatus Omnitrophica bacterium]|nr:PilT/PilU family type 4a pilus ATPase [Candidatus Omnitrophota bacterium]